MPLTRPRLPIVPAALALLAACSGGGTSPTPTPSANCNSPATITLTAGQYQVVDPSATNGCVRLPAPGSTGAEDIVGVVSGAGQVTQTGVSGP